MEPISRPQKWIWASNTKNRTDSTSKTIN